MTHPLFRSCLVALLIACAARAHGFGIFNADGLEGGTRWDAAPRNIDGHERSLAGGLRYSVQGGSYLAFRNQFTWQSMPTKKQFVATVRKAFNAWTVQDPATGLRTSLRFVPDFATSVDERVVNGVRLGAEIDLFAATDANSWDPGSNRYQGETGFHSRSTSSLKLTSGTTGRTGYAMTGVDITLNANAQAAWTLGWFRLVLAHEIGHALGLDDVDLDSGPGGTFIDDNFDPARPGATLTNAFAKKIKPGNPAASAKLKQFTVLNDATGFEAPAANLLMESNLDSALLARYPYLSSDEFAGRQFLYPWRPESTAALRVVPEPATISLLLCGVAGMRRRIIRGA